MFYSRSTNGFYVTEIHGSRIPNDAVHESKWAYTHAQLMEGQSKGMTISSDENGFPIIVDPAAPTPTQIILGQIKDLEATATERRVREAVLGIDSGWLKALDDQVAALRAKLK